MTTAGWSARSADRQAPSTPSSSRARSATAARTMFSTARRGRDHRGEETEGSLVPGLTPSGRWVEPFGTHERASVRGYEASSYRTWAVDRVFGNGRVVSLTDPPLGWVRGDTTTKRPQRVRRGRAYVITSCTPPVLEVDRWNRYSLRGQPPPIVSMAGETRIAWNEWNRYSLRGQPPPIVSMAGETRIAWNDPVL